MAQSKNKSDINWDACTEFVLKKAQECRQILSDLHSEYPEFGTDVMVWHGPPYLWIHVWVPVAGSTSHGNRKRAGLDLGGDRSIIEVFAVMTEAECERAGELISRLPSDLKGKPEFPHDATHYLSFELKPRYQDFTHHALTQAARAEEFTAAGRALLSLEEQTYALQHSPNCPKPFLVRLVGSSAVLDLKPAHETNDILGYGLTLPEAAKEALELKASLHNASMRAAHAARKA